MRCTQDLPAARSGPRPPGSRRTPAAPRRRPFDRRRRPFPRPVVAAHAPSDAHPPVDQRQPSRSSVPSSRTTQLQRLRRRLHEELSAVRAEGHSSLAPFAARGTSVTADSGPCSCSVSPSPRSTALPLARRHDVRHVGRARTRGRRCRGRPCRCVRRSPRRRPWARCSVIAPANRRSTEVLSPEVSSARRPKRPASEGDPASVADLDDQRRLRRFDEERLVDLDPGTPFGSRAPGPESKGTPPSS